MTTDNPSQEQSFNQFKAAEGIKTLYGIHGAKSAWDNRTAHYQKELAAKDAEILKVQQNYNLLYGIHQEVETQGKQRIAELEADLKYTRDAFRHCHVSWDGHDDTCGQCGLDLRNPVHERLMPLPEPPTEEEPKTDSPGRNHVESGSGTDTLE